MKHKSVKLLQAVDSGNELAAVIPPGNYYVGDPCYVLGKELYQELGELIFPPGDGNGRDIEVEVELEDGTKVRIVDWRTAHGDGRYPVMSPAGQGSVAVDSGGLAVVDLRLCDANKYTEERLAELAHGVILTEPARLRTEGGDARLDGFFTLCTEDAKDEDDD